MAQHTAELEYDLWLTGHWVISAGSGRVTAKCRTRFSSFTVCTYRSAACSKYDLYRRHASDVRLAGILGGRRGGYRTLRWGEK